MRRDGDSDRSVDTRELLDRERVLHVAEAGAVPLFREKDAEQTELGGLGHDFPRELLALVELHHVRPDLALGELAHRVPQELLVFRKAEIHGVTPPCPFEVVPPRESNFITRGRGDIMAQRNLGSNVAGR